MKINLDHFETIEELEKDLISWIKEEDIYSFDRYLNKEDVLTIVQLLIKKENIIKEVRESAKRELKIAEENIKYSEQWLEVEEEHEHAKKDIHTGKVVKRYMEMFLKILDKEVN